MRIGFDATPAAQGAGVGRYTWSLLRALLAAASGESDEYVLVLARGAHPPKLPTELSGVRTKGLLLSERACDVLWHRARLPLPLDWWVPGLDVFHSPNFLLPPLRAAAGVVTVHDLSFLKLPHLAYPRLAAYLQRAIGSSLERAAAIVADSENTAADLVSVCGVPADKVRVVYPGVDAKFSPAKEEGEASRLAKRYSLAGPYLLAVGTIEPRKNYPAAIEAFLKVRGYGLFGGEFVIAGGEGWLAEESMQAVRRAEGHVRLLGRVPEEDLPALYRGAVALVYPSFYEGFGLPPLEAMACGTPVVVARTSSLPEVVGGAGLYCSTSSPSIAEALAELVSDEGLRTSLAAAGIERARLFSWERTAAEVREVYAQIA